ncbi:Bax inhibitor-1 family protein, partial [Thermodesulfobacteriota bacterium]
YYNLIYKTLSKEKNFVKLDSLHNKILREELVTDIPYYDRIRDFLVTDTVKNLYLIRHGETFFNLEDRIGGDSELTENGWTQKIKNMALTQPADLDGGVIRKGAILGALSLYLDFINLFLMLLRIFGGGRD